MGLAERRVIKSFQEGRFVEITDAITEIVGRSISIDVDWESLAEDEMSHMYEEAWDNVYFVPLIDALKSICADDMGKEALMEGLDKIVVKNSDGVTSASYWSKLDQKTLTLDHKPTSNIDYHSERSSELQKVLEDKL